MYTNRFLQCNCPKTSFYSTCVHKLRELMDSSSANQEQVTFATNKKLTCISFSIFCHLWNIWKNGERKDDKETFANNQKLTWVRLIHLKISEIIAEWYRKANRKLFSQSGKKLLQQINSWHVSDWYIVKYLN